MDQSDGSLLVPRSNQYHMFSLACVWSRFIAFVVMLCLLGVSSCGSSNSVEDKSMPGCEAVSVTYRYKPEDSLLRMDGLRWFGFVDGAFYAKLHLERKNVDRWIRSFDGGKSWAMAKSPLGLPSQVGVIWYCRAPMSAGLYGFGYQQCAIDGVCYRVTLGSSQDQSSYYLYRREPGKEWVVESRIYFPAPIYVNPYDSSQVMVSGVFRDDKGFWHDASLRMWAAATR